MQSEFLKKIEQEGERKGRREGRREGRRALLEVAARFATTDQKAELGAIEDFDELERSVLELVDASRNGGHDDSRG